VIDHRGFPHIIECVIAFAGYEALSALAKTCTQYRKALGAQLDHVVVTPRVLAGDGDNDREPVHPFAHFSVACRGYEHLDPIVLDPRSPASASASASPTSAASPSQAGLMAEYLSRAGILDINGTLASLAVQALVRATPRAHTLRIVSGEWSHSPAGWGVRTLVSLTDHNITDAYADIGTVVVGMRLHHRYMPTALCDLSESEQEVHFIFPTVDAFGHDLARPIPASALPRQVAFTRSSIYRVLAYAHLSLLRGQRHLLVGITEYHPEWYDITTASFSAQILRTRLANYAYNLLCGPGGSGYNGDAARERQIADSILFPTFDEYCTSHPHTVACLGEWAR
jgi:hypothetical protein